MAKTDNPKQKYHNIFDKVFHTLAIRMPQFIIPIINLLYGLNIPLNAVIIQLRNEFYENDGTLITDSLYMIDRQIFHFECQSITDHSMSTRMFQYDTSIAIEYSPNSGDELCLTYPVSAVIYLRPNRHRIQHSLNLSFPNGTGTCYRTAIINVQDYTKEDIFEKNLFLFLPFYIMRYEKLFKNNTYDEAWINKFLNEFADIRDRVYDEFPRNRRLCNDIFELIIQISDYILRGHDNIKERMRHIMGGEVLELYSERMERFENEAIARGLAKGMTQGIAQGIAQKATEIITNMIKLNLPLETISAATGYSHDEILDIRKGLQLN